MGHPTIDEFCRAHDFRPDFLRRCQRVFREEVNPAIDERDRLLVENKAQADRIQALEAQLSEANDNSTPRSVDVDAAEGVKRARRKVEAATV